MLLGRESSFVCNAKIFEDKGVLFGKKEYFCRLNWERKCGGAVLLLCRNRSRYTISFGDKLNYCNFMTSKSTKAVKDAEHVDPEQKIETALDRTELFLQKYQKQLLIGLLVVVLCVGGFFAYKYLVVSPRTKKAAEIMFVAQQLFAEENYKVALEGDGSNAGFIDVVQQYGSTPAGHLAAHYAGICYLKSGDMDSALDYLRKYKTVKGAPGVIINAQNFGLQGDIYVEKNDLGKAVDMYVKAVDAADNVLTTPYYLRKLALVYAEQGKVDEAVAACNRIKTEYASSLEARDIDKYVGEFEQQK